MWQAHVKTRLVEMKKTRWPKDDAKNLQVKKQVSTLCS